MATENWVNIGSGNDLLPDGTKPLPEPMSTYHQSLKSVSKLHVLNFIQTSQGPMS